MILKIKINDQMYRVRVGNVKERPILVEVEGNTYEVWPESQSEESTSPNSEVNTDQQRRSNVAQQLDVHQSGLIISSTSSSDKADIQRLKSIRAPIPGIITAVYVSAGTQVSVGQELLKLEAMKMNNSIRSNHAGIIRGVHVSTGQIVKLNQLLLEFEN